MLVSSLTIGFLDCWIGLKLKGDPNGGTMVRMAPTDLIWGF